MLRFKLVFLVLASLFASFGLANATANIHIDLSTQTMHVDSNSGSYSWPVSTARAGYSTPRGSYAPTGMERMHYSRKYHMSPMPYSIFFRGGYAIHGTYATGALGSPASHGCVRLAPGNAKRLYDIVQAEGGSISITGASPARGARYAKAHHRNPAHYASLRHSHRSSAMAYAPVRHSHRVGTVRSWQYHPFADF
ncbi:MAG: L,D-transpeptidase [Methylocystis sp.]|nr:MAG: L,D-transpeptidase [Methylocystis sp.]